MAYFELYTTATGSDTNGGSSATDAADVTKANCSSDGAGTAITNDAADGWGTAANDDIICFDTAGTKDFAKITNVAGDVLTVTPAVALSASSKNVTVGGAQADPTVTFDMIQGNPTWFSDGTPPRMNIEEGTYTLSGTLLPTVHGTPYKPWVIQGYKTAAGTQPDTPPILQYGSGSVLDTNSIDYFHVQDVHLKRTGTSGYCWDFSRSVACYARRVTFEASAGSVDLMNQPEGMDFFDECTFVNSGTASGDLFVPIVGSVPFVNCLIDNVDTQAYGMFVNCRFTYSVGIGRYSFLVNCLVEPAAGQNGISLDASAVWLAVVINTIIQDAPSTFYGARADAANFNMFVGHHNSWYNNVTGDRLNIENYQGDGDIATDPDLDVNYRAQAGSDAIGAGTPLYVDIGVKQHEDAGGGGVTLVNTRRNAMIGR